MMQNKAENNVERKEDGHLWFLGDHGCIVIIASLVCVGCVATAGFDRSGGSERLLEVADDVVNVFCANADADQVLRDTRSNPLLLRQLLVGCRPRVNGKSLRISNIGQVRDQLEAIDDLGPGSSTTFDTKTQNTAESALEISLSKFVRRMALETRV
jgi:hypothetical protein